MSDENKPNWNDAPEWANYLAQDKTGRWWWFKDEPVIRGEQWRLDAFTTMEAYYLDDEVWKSTLQSRPKQVISIDWNNVPEHLNYFAFDDDGAGFFFHEKPVWDEEFKNWQRAETDEVDWTIVPEIIKVDKMLLKRPDGSKNG